jgi:hypothetical protein
MIDIDLQIARELLLPRSGWAPWEKPKPALAIDEWVSKQNLQRGILPAHIEHDGCPYWYARRGVAIAAELASQQDESWTEKQDYIKDSLQRYEGAAKDIREKTQELIQLISSFWQLHLGIDGNMFRYDHYSVPDVPRKPEIDALEVMRYLTLLPDVLKLKAVSNAAAVARKRWVNTQGDVWKNIFVGHLGLIWQDLVGKPPTLSDPFQQFVADAWASLHPKGGDAVFDRAIRTITEGFRTPVDGR